MVNTYNVPKYLYNSSDFISPNKINNDIYSIAGNDIQRTTNPYQSAPSVENQVSDAINFVLTNDMTQVGAPNLGVSTGNNIYANSANADNLLDSTANNANYLMSLPKALNTNIYANSENSNNLFNSTNYNYDYIVHSFSNNANTNTFAGSENSNNLFNSTNDNTSFIFGLGVANGSNQGLSNITHFYYPDNTGSMLPLKEIDNYYYPDPKGAMPQVHNINGYYYKDGQQMQVQPTPYQGGNYYGQQMNPAQNFAQAPTPYIGQPGQVAYSTQAPDSPIKDYYRNPGVVNTGPVANPMPAPLPSFNYSAQQAFNAPAAAPQYGPVQAAAPTPIVMQAPPQYAPQPVMMQVPPQYAPQPMMMQAPQAAPSTARASVPPVAPQQAPVSPMLGFSAIAAQAKSMEATATFSGNGFSTMLTMAYDKVKNLFTMTMTGTNA